MQVKVERDGLAGRDHERREAVADTVFACDVDQERCFAVAARETSADQFRVRG